MTAAGPVTAPTVARQRYARGDGDRLRQDLIDAAIDLLGEHGDAEAVSLRAVARRVGVSPTAVYRHFTDHDELLRAAVEHSWSTFHDALDQARSSSDDPFVAFRRCGEAYVRHANDHQGQYRVMFSNKIDVPGAPASTGMAAFQILVDLVAAMLAARGDDRDALFVAVQVHTWIHGIVDLCGSHPDGPWPSIDDQLNGLVGALGLRR